MKNLAVKLISIVALTIIIAVGVNATDLSGNGLRSSFGWSQANQEAYVSCDLAYNAGQKSGFPLLTEEPGGANRCSSSVNKVAAISNWIIYIILAAGIVLGAGCLLSRRKKQ